MLIPIGVALRDSKSGGQHVHQPVVSRLRHPRLPLHPHRLPGRRHDLHHPPGTRDLPMLRLRLAPGPVARPGRTPLPHHAHRQPRHLRRPAHPARRMPGLWRRATGQGPLRRPAAQLHQGLRALRPGVGPPHDHPRRGGASGRQLGRDQGHPEARPLASLRQAQTQAPAPDRHRRDRHRQGTPLRMALPLAVLEVTSSRRRPARRGLARAVWSAGGAAWAGA